MAVGLLWWGYFGGGYFGAGLLSLESLQSAAIIIPDSYGSDKSNSAPYRLYPSQEAVMLPLTKNQLLTKILLIL